jgi:hypothetical protein
MPPVIRLDARLSPTANVANAQLTTIDPNSPTARSLAGIVAIVETAFKAAREIAADPARSSQGRATATEAVVSKAEADLAAFDPLVRAQEQALAEWTAKAAATPAATGDPLLAQAREAEIRSALMAMDKTSRGPIYLKAVTVNDWETCRAVENAPQSFPVVDAATLDQGRRLKAEQHSLKPELDRRDGELHALKVVLATGRRDVSGLRLALAVTRPRFGGDAA